MADLTMNFEFFLCKLPCRLRKLHALRTHISWVTSARVHAYIMMELFLGEQLCICILLILMWLWSPRCIGWSAALVVPFYGLQFIFKFVMCSIGRREMCLFKILIIMWALESLICYSLCGHAYSQLQASVNRCFMETKKKKKNSALCICNQVLYCLFHFGF